MRHKKGNDSSVKLRGSIGVRVGKIEPFRSRFFIANGMILLLDSASRNAFWVVLELKKLTSLSYVGITTSYKLY